MQAPPLIGGAFRTIREQLIHRYMLKKNQRLTKKQDFTKLATQGRSVFGPFATMRVRPVRENEKRVAFITSTKVFKKAVDRNRVKRRMREVVRGLFTIIPPNVHLLFILKPEALKAPYPGLVAEVERLLTKIPEALSKPPQLSPSAKKRQAKGRL